MKFTEPIYSGLFLKRYKRFFADIRLPDGSEHVAHVPNTGSLKGCTENPAECRFTLSSNPERKLKHTLQMIRVPKTWVGVNTSLPPTLVWEAWEEGRMAHWKSYDCAQKEVKISDESRIDLILWNSSNSYEKGEKLTLQHCRQKKKNLHFVEIKNVTLADGHHALFPDCVSTRAQKHLRELMTVVKRGHSAEILFVVQRGDCRRFRAAHECDPAYAELLAQAFKVGVKITALPCEMGSDSILLKSEPLPVDF